MQVKTYPESSISLQILLNLLAAFIYIGKAFIAHTLEARQHLASGSIFILKLFLFYLSNTISAEMLHH